MKTVIATILMVIVTSAPAQTWIEYENKSYLGGYYFAVCNICLSGSYNNDGGLWACTDTRSKDLYQKGCAKALWDAFLAKAEEH